MAVKSNKQRITITVSKEMADKLDLYSQKMGVNRSAMCAQFIGQAIMSYDKAYDVIDEMAKKMANEEINKE